MTKNNPFSVFLTDTISLLKKNGEEIADIKASVSQKGIQVMREDILIESGDLIQRQMSNGGEETYEVIDPNFTEAWLDMPACYSLKVRKLGIPETEKAIQKITYNISGHNPRINQNSIDCSTNTVNINPDIAQHISDLRKTIQELEISMSEKESANEIVDAVEDQFKSGIPKKNVISALLNALPKAANLASIASLILQYAQQTP